MKIDVFFRSQSPINFKYSLNWWTGIDVVTRKEDLDVLFNLDLNFYSYIWTVYDIDCRALKMLGFIIRILKEFKLSVSLKPCTVLLLITRIFDSSLGLGFFYGRWLFTFKASSKAFLIICSLYLENYSPSAWLSTSNA